jgi:hypothetical protein
MTYTHQVAKSASEQKNLSEAKMVVVEFRFSKDLVALGQAVHCKVKWSSQGVSRVGRPLCLSVLWAGFGQSSTEMFDQGGGGHLNSEAGSLDPLQAPCTFHCHWQH